ncbi:MAG: vitamin-B12 independent methionine synthase, partial [Deltaproteobacteria bacterium]|nr:vitamin-B12 independent methionine synthase [Deltaproteobacteria bacterium]MBW2531906.1 vitamin-B12 independent methionine synthase [Deltaproteobacteria bacterium]
ALRDKQRGKLSRAEFNRLADGEVRRCLDAQLDAGVELVTDGELRRDNFYSFVTDKLDGTELYSLAELLERMDDKSEFEEMLHTLDVPASAIRNPTCVGKLSRREPLAGDELSFLAQRTDRPIKVTLPGPYLLTRSMWIGRISRGAAYQDKTEMARDVVGILRDELSDLRDAGVAFVQFDEPVLTEVVLSEECERRTFM